MKIDTDMMIFFFFYKLIMLLAIILGPVICLGIPICAAYSVFSKKCNGNHNLPL